MSLHSNQNISSHYSLSFLNKVLNTRKLVKLRILDIDDCQKLNTIPNGIGKLSRLKKLTRSLLGVDTNLENQLEDLKVVLNFKGYIGP